MPVLCVLRPGEGGPRDHTPKESTRGHYGGGGAGGRLLVLRLGHPQEPQPNEARAQPSH